MDADMKEKITMGMMVGCLLLALVAMFTTSWLSDDDNNASLSTVYFKADSKTECEGIADLMDGYECDGTIVSATYSDAEAMCEDMAAAFGGDDSECAEMGEAATAGTVGAVFMWLGVVVTLILVLMAVLPMAGVDTLNDLMGNLPDICVTIMNWAAGGLMIAGVVLWLLLIPDGDMDMGYSAYLAIVAGLMGLGSTGMNTFMGDE